MKFGVVVFPGSNCDRDIIHVLQNVMQVETKVLWHKDRDLSDFNTEDFIVLPGGFSYGDYLRAGAIARFSPIMESVIDFANRGGRVFGICNGFQILCEAGLLPGAVLRNTSGNFICKNVYLKTLTRRSEITSTIPEGKILKIPIAHADGRYFADEKTLEAIKQNDQILFQYASATGLVDDANNANGSMLNIAGICNENRNVFGMMPHPERAAETALGNEDGRLLFESILSAQGVPA